MAIQAAAGAGVASNPSQASALESPRHASQESPRNIEQRVHLQYMQRMRDDQLMRKDEQLQTRSLVSSMVHALKTPLHAFQADTATLEELFDEIDPAAMAAARARVRAKRRAARGASADLASADDRDANDDGDDDDIDPPAVFSTMWATSKMLIATVNRGQDYAQAAIDVKLTPINGSVKLATVLDAAACCMRAIAPPGRRLVLHPVTADTSVTFCPWVLTDGQWLLENLMCYIDNALCYSANGDVDIYAEVIPINKVCVLSIRVLLHTSPFHLASICTVADAHPPPRVSTLRIRRPGGRAQHCSERGGQRSRCRRQ